MISPPDGDTQFAIGSVSKVFTSLIGKFKSAQELAERILSGLERNV